MVVRSKTVNKFGLWASIASIPSITGYGDLVSAKKLVDFAVESHLDYLQVLPVLHSIDSSPFMTWSAFAGDPRLISLAELKRLGLIKNIPKVHTPYKKIDYEWVTDTHMTSLAEAYGTAAQRGMLSDDKYIKFKNKHSFWLDDYAFFMAYMEAYKWIPMTEWKDKKIKMRNASTIKVASECLSNRIEFYKYIQFLFFTQWDEFRRYANDNKIKLVGDMPFYVTNIDIWAHPVLFKVDNDLRPLKVGGCPPDNFAEKGQRWGNPVYDWEYHKNEGYRWWIMRFKHAFYMFDILKLDHFLGFYQYYEIDADKEDGRDGIWKDGPKAVFFEIIKNAIPEAVFIAEDLGHITDGVRDMLKATGFVGMRLMPYELESKTRTWQENKAIYVANHDSPTIVSAINEAMQNNLTLKDILGSEVEENQPLGMAAIAAACSCSNMVFFGFTEVLSLDDTYRTNTPGTQPTENWKVIIPGKFFVNSTARSLAELISKYK